MSRPVLPTEDPDFVAHVDILGARIGATEFEVGYLHDDVPVEQAGWYCAVKFRGARQTEENHRGPVEAAAALARKLLHGGGCKCGRRVTVADQAPDPAAGLCWWQVKDTPDGRRWTPGCDAPAMDYGAFGGQQGDLAAMRAAFDARAAVLARGGNRAERRRKPRPRRG